MSSRWIVANADEVARKLVGIPSVSTMTARFVQTNSDGTVLVDGGGLRPIGKFQCLVVDLLHADSPVCACY